MKLWTKILQYLCIISRTEGVYYDTQPIKERVFCNNNQLARIGRKFEEWFFDGPIR